jgi:hypothetical protein
VFEERLLDDLGHMLMAANLRAQLTAIGWLP